MVSLTKGENFKSEYSAKIVKIPSITHIEGTDKLGVVYVNGFTIVVDDTMTKEGDVMLYACNETCLNKQFLGVNNQFRNKDMNVSDDITGYFEDNGRVKNIKLKGTYSWGVLFGLDAVEKWTGDTFGDVESVVGEEFDTINGNLFCEAYVPKTDVRGMNNRRGTRKSQNKVDKFSRVEPGQFNFHYDTTPLGHTQGIFDLDTDITISVKVHGTSAIYANILTREPIKMNFLKSTLVRAYNSLYDNIRERFDFGESVFGLRRIPTYNSVYGNIYSSRKIIKNQYVYDEDKVKVGDGYYGEDVWESTNNLIKDFIPKGYTVYGEIVGYTGGGKCIQKSYDYGCSFTDPNKPINKFMPYRITVTDEQGNVTEKNMSEVVEWTSWLISQLPSDKQNLVEKIPVVYTGTVGDLLGAKKEDFDCSEDSRRFSVSDKFLMSLKKMFGMEGNEPLCSNKVPREGVVIRITDDIHSRAFKLKAEKFLAQESKNIGNGEVDIETAETYCDTQDA